jgi:hypothetical protein
VVKLIPSAIAFEPSHTFLPTHVVKGAKGIAILAPCVCRKKACQTQSYIVVLVNLEMTDKLRIVILLSIPVGAYNFGTVRDSLGVIPKPSGAPG